MPLKSGANEQTVAHNQIERKRYMTSKLKSETARINGAKSKGPKTPDGRAKSAKNSTKHGLTAVSTIVLDCESEDEFNELLAEFVAMHLPVGAIEQDAVEQMAVARLHVRRISTAMTAVIDVEMARRKPETEKEFPGADPGIHMGLAIKALSDDSRSLALFSRYKSREQRTCDRAYKTLRELQAARKAEATTGIPACVASSEIQDPKSTGPESHNPAPKTEPEPSPKSERHAKSPLESISFPTARARNMKFQNEPPVRSLRRRFRLRRLPIHQSAASLRCRR